MLLLVRPKPKLASSLRYFEEHNIHACGVAPVDIKTLDVGMKACGELLKQPKANNTCFIITSTEAASRFNQLAQQNSFRGDTVLCVGDSTAKLVSSLFVHCLIPSIQTSEGIVEQLSDIVKNQDLKHFALIKGEAGRNVIKPFFEKTANEVLEYNLYKRLALSAPFESKQIKWEQITTVVVTSVFLLQCLLNAYPKKELQNKTWIVPSERVKGLALSLGCKHIVCSDGATNAHLLGCIRKLHRGLT